MQDRGMQPAPGRSPDTLTLVAISALAYVLAVALHEHGGHATACLLMGSHPKELGAFYVDCDDNGLSSVGMRIVALAGPVASLLTGVLALLVLRIKRKRPGSTVPQTQRAPSIATLAARPAHRP